MVKADEPIHIAANPDTYGGTQLDMDHWHWYNLYLIGNGNPAISIDSGLVLTDDIWDGFEAWVAGTYGLYWSNSGVTTASYRSPLKT